MSSRAEGLREGLDLDRVSLEAAVADVLGVFLTGDLGTLSASSALDGSSSYKRLTKNAQRLFFIILDISALMNAVMLSAKAPWQYAFQYFKQYRY